MESISVALCTYNGEEFLPKQLDSIKQQTKPIHELVVCDDGSRDATIEILEKFRQSVSFPLLSIRIQATLEAVKILNNVFKNARGRLYFYVIKMTYGCQIRWN